MSSYLRSWLPTLSLQQQSTANPTTEEEEESPTTPTNPSVSVQDADDDSPPAFPAIESAQRISLAPSTLMPPPPIPSSRIPGPPAPSSLMPPPSTTKPPTQLSKSKKREKVVLAPGHSPLDWAALKSSGADLRVCLFASERNLHLLTTSSF
jgi:N-acetylmuramoyl-L-alanine amidase